MQVGAIWDAFLESPILFIYELEFNVSNFGLIIESVLKIFFDGSY